MTKFLDKFFPPGRTSIIKDMIIRFRQGDNEPIKDAWIRFQDLIRQSPHHGLNKDDGWNRIEEYVQYHDITWEEPAPTMNISSISKIIKPTFEGRLKRAQEQLYYLTTPKGAKSLKNPYLICDICGGAHEADECDSNGAHEQVCLSGGDIYDDPSLLRFYQNDDILP
ncbi:reverse transcriptase [Tanacetum coccineum]|uniref:Reverse transcriptase n=1 Tax=Tanacetum coccineum TaxID=301880 RepID=A0ABQ4YF25_9ASTR